MIHRSAYQLKEADRQSFALPSRWAGRLVEAWKAGGAALRFPLEGPHAVCGMRPTRVSGAAPRRSAR
jgi:hypothetical protein